jgi:predicted Holliday junction resolvase-like endonuclease
MSDMAVVIAVLCGAAALLFGLLYISTLVRLKGIVRDARADDLERSRAITVGNFTQHFVPHMPDFAFDPRDVRFLGSPIDFVVFDGLSEGDLRRIVLVEVKTGNASLSARERAVRDAVVDRRVQWLEYRAATPAATH